MNEIFTRSLEENNVKFLEEFPRALLNEDEIEIASRILELNKKHGKTPSVRRIMEEFDYFIPYRFAPSSWELEEPVISDVFDQAVERRIKDVTKRNIREAQAALKDNPDKAFKILDEIREIQAIDIGEEDSLWKGGTFMKIWDEETNPTYVVDQLVEARSLNLWFAPPKNMKTSSVYDLFVSCANGDKEWCGKKLSNTGPAIIFDRQMGKRRAFQKLRQIAAGRGFEEGKDLPLTVISGANLDFGDETGLIKLEAKIEETGAKLILFDSLTDFIPGRSQAKFDEYYPYLNKLRPMAEKYDCSFIFIHYPSASGDAYGGPIQYGLYDMVLKLDLSEKLNCLTVTRISGRQANNWSEFTLATSPTDQTEYYSLEVVPEFESAYDGEAEEEEEAKESARAKRERIKFERLQVLYDQGEPATYTEWVEALIEADLTTVGSFTRQLKSMRKDENFRGLFMQMEDGKYKVTPEFERIVVG